MHILVVGTGNSCRSIMAEALINDLGNRKFSAVSAGSHPLGYVHPQALKILENHSIDPGMPASKSWNIFATRHFDLVVTVCNKPLAEAYPLFPGKPQKMYWAIPDPAAVTGSYALVQNAFDRVFFMIRDHVQNLIEKQSAGTHIPPSSQHAASN